MSPQSRWGIPAAANSRFSAAQRGGEGAVLFPETDFPGLGIDQAAAAAGGVHALGHGVDHLTRPDLLQPLLAGNAVEQRNQHRVGAHLAGGVPDGAFQLGGLDREDHQIRRLLFGGGNIVKFACFPVAHHPFGPVAGGPVLVGDHPQTAVGTAGQFVAEQNTQSPQSHQRYSVDGHTKPLLGVKSSFLIIPHPTPRRTERQPHKYSQRFYFSFARDVVQ